MGTNFYTKEGKHVGKRSAAGPYCWDCGVSLVDGRVHSSKSQILDACPYCHRTPSSEPLTASSAGRELGFNKEKPCRKQGIQSCSSFKWALTLGEFFKLEGEFKDEYDCCYTQAEFLELLEECPLMFFHLNGKFL